MKVLVTTGEWKSSLTVMRSLARLGHEIHLLCSSANTPHRYSKFCSASFITPPETQMPAYLEFLLDHLARNAYGLLIPSSDACIRAFSENRELLSSRVPMVLPDKAAVAIASDKTRTYRLAMEIGVAIPKTYFPESEAEAASVADSIAYPCMLKAPVGTGGGGNAAVHDKASLLRHFAAAPAGARPVIQEFVTGPLAGFTAVCQEGEILEHFMFEVTRAAGLNDALLSRAKSIHSEVCFAHAAALAKKLRWTGAFDLDFCHAGKDRYLLYEINPRFSGTIQFAYNCGVDLPRALFELSQGEVKKRPRARYSEHRMYRSVFPEEFDRVILQRGQWADFLLGFLDPRYSYDFSLRDRRLLLWQLRIAKWKLQDEKGRARTRASRRLTQPPPEK